MAVIMKSSGIPWIGEIPIDWETDEIRYTFEQVKSLNFLGNEDNLLSLSYGRIIQKDIESSFGLLPENFDTYNIIENGDIVLRLTDLQNDQKSLRVGFSEQHGIITSAYLTLRLKSNGFAKFFYYLLHAYDLQKIFYGMGAGVRQGLNWDELKRASVIFPNSIEQKLIADFLDTECDKIDGIIIDMQNQVDILKAYRDSSITKAVTKGLDNLTQLKGSGVIWIGKIPNRWTVKPLKYCIEKIDGGTWGEDANEFDLKIKVLRSTEQDIMGNWVLKDPEIRSLTRREFVSTKLNEGDLILTKSSGSSTHIGKTSLVTSEMEKEDYSFSNFMQRIKISKSHISKYYFYLLNSSFVRMQYNFLSNTTTGLSNLNTTMIKSVKVPVPDKDEQKAIADYLDEECAKIDAIIKDKQAAIDTMWEYKKSLIYEYVTGKKRVGEAQ